MVSRMHENNSYYHTHSWPTNQRIHIITCICGQQNNQFILSYMHSWSVNLWDEHAVSPIPQRFRALCRDEEKHIMAFLVAQSLRPDVNAYTTNVK